MNSHVLINPLALMSCCTSDLMQSMQASKTTQNILKRLQRACMLAAPRARHAPTPQTDKNFQPRRSRKLKTSAAVHIRSWHGGILVSATSLSGTRSFRSEAVRIFDMQQAQRLGSCRALLPKAHENCRASELRQTKFLLWLNLGRLS